MSRRNNVERLGAPHPDAPSPITSEQNNDLFSFVTPTEFVDLPSKGERYLEEHPLHHVDTIEIKHMTAKEEDILTSETLLKKGLAIDRLVESVILDKNIKLKDLLIGDKNAILLAARITGFGPLYKAAITCPSCDVANDEEFNLESIENKEVNYSEVEETERGTFILQLPISKMSLEVRLLTSADEHILTQNAEKKKKLRLPETNATTLLSAIVVSVNDVKDRGQILKFIESMPLRDSQYIKDIYEMVKPDINMHFDFACEACSHVGEVIMPLTAEFFWPHR